MSIMKNIPIQQTKFAQTLQNILSTMVVLGFVILLVWAIITVIIQGRISLRMFQIGRFAKTLGALFNL